MLFVVHIVSRYAARVVGVGDKLCGAILKAEIGQHPDTVDDEAGVRHRQAGLGEPTHWHIGMKALRRRARFYPESANLGQLKIRPKQVTRQLKVSRVGNGRHEYVLVVVIGYGAQVLNQLVCIRLAGP